MIQEKTVEESSTIVSGGIAAVSQLGTRDQDVSASAVSLRKRADAEARLLMQRSIASPLATTTALKGPFIGDRVSVKQHKTT